MDRVRRWLWSICWEIGDTFMGYAMRLEGPPDDTWIKIDIHAKCQPKREPSFVITSSTVPTYSTGNSTTVHWQ